MCGVKPMLVIVSSHIGELISHEIDESSCFGFCMPESTCWLAVSPERKDLDVARRKREIVSHIRSDSWALGLRLRLRLRVLCVGA